MRLLIATKHRNVIGGVETYLHALIPALLQHGHQVAMLYDYVPAAADATVDPPDAHLPVWYCDRLCSDPQLWRELIQWNAAVVYSHGISSPDIAQRLHQNHPTVRYLHDYEGTCMTGRKCHSFPASRPCHRTFGRPCLLLHYPRRCGGLNPVVAFRMFQTQKAFHSLLPEYQAILLASAYMCSELRNHGVSREKLHLVRLPLSGSPASAAPLQRAPAGRLLFVGRLIDVKGIDFVIRALPVAEKKLGRRLTLTIAGDGPGMTALQRLARAQKGAIEFAGWVDGTRKWDLMRQSDLLVVPSLWPEPFGMVGIEAGSVGLPAAGFAAGGIPEWLLPGRTGELAGAEPPTVEGLADAIARALRDPAHYNHLRREAYEFSRQVTLQQHVDQLETILCAHASIPQSCAGALHPGPQTC